MNDRFHLMYLFIRVARTGSFSLAGRELGMSQPTASRLVAELEKKVGVALLTRTTRAVTLTEAGADYLVRAESILAALDEAGQFARGTGELRGTLRVAASSAFAVRGVLPGLSRFTDQHPALRLEFVLDDQWHDLVGESIDVALRVGDLADSTAVAHKIGVNRRVVVASPAYLARAGKPRVPSDLPAHSIIVGPAGRGTEGWMFRKNGKPASVRVQARFAMNGTEASIAAAVAGLGIVSSGLMSCLAELESGSLVQVLSDWEMGEVDINVILPAGRAAKPSARAFTDFMKQEFQSPVFPRPKPRKARPPGA
jgi:DNA-binding transcriptional LysR family regulator